MGLALMRRCSGSGIDRWHCPKTRKSSGPGAGSSDAVRIMAGDWTALWREKTGREEAPRLDFVPAVQIGIATEHLHPRFYTFRTGIGACPADHRTYVHPRFDHIVANLDFMTWGEPPLDPAEPPDTILEAKFHSGFKTDEDLATKYYWQLQHQMMVSGFPRSVLSVLRPVRIFLPDGGAQRCRCGAAAGNHPGLLVEQWRTTWNRVIRCRSKPPISTL